ncbi:MAG TPA: response regulator [Roseiflexaceae bacterium]|nr:response regulator [Roseiflexaceae bacterium]
MTMPRPDAPRPLVLVVEDNPTTRKLLRVALAGAGYAVAEAADGRSALALASERAPDLILQDMVLPDVEGGELLARLRATPGCAETPILALSGFLARGEELPGGPAGFTDMLLKPVEPSRLVQIVQAHLPPAAPPAEPPGRGRRVIVADDDPVQRKLLGLRLRHLGFQVTLAEDGQAALELALAAPPAAIVSDILMPRRDGFELCLAVRREARLEAVPVILVTSSYIEDADRQLARRVGANAYVLRTPELQEVIDALLSSLAARGSPPPAAAPAELTQEHAHRVIRQLERQAAANATLVQDSAIQAAQLFLLAGVSEVLTRGADVEQVLDEVLGRCLDAAGMSQGAVYLAAPDGRLTLHARLGYAAARVEALATFFGHTQLLYESLRARQFLTIPSAELPARQAEELLGQAGARSMLLTPLFYGSEPLGVVVMASASQALSEDWLVFARAVGFQISQAIALSRTVALLAESEQRYRDLVQGLDAIVWEADPATFRFSFVSRQAERILGYPPEQWLATPDFWVRHIHPDDREEAVAFCQLATAEARDHDFEYRALGSGGRVVWLHDIVRVVRDEEGRAVKLRGVMVDITRQKELENQFYQAQKMEAIGRLAGGVAHDFNNLLTAIIGYSDLLLGDMGPGDGRRADVEEIRRAAERASALTRQLLAFSRKQILAPQVLDLNAVVTNIDKMLRRLIGEDIVLTIVLDPALGHVKADPGQLEQVIVNIVVNARDAMPRGGQLTIATANVDLSPRAAAHHISLPPGRYVTLAVEDTGMGMDAETRAQIFEPFFTTKERGKGTGLGLSTVYGIVKQSGGDIEVESEPGQGTTFRIYLPRVDEPAAAAAQERPAVPPHGTETILLVEDEEGVRTLLQKLLERSGYTVLAAPRGEVALEIAARHAGPIHLVITDVVMPGMSGRDLVQSLLALRPAMRALYISGYSTGALQLPHPPDAALLQKPFRTDDLLRRVREVLGGG